MTHGKFIDELLLRLKRGDVGVSMDPLTASEMLNKAYFFLYPVALKHFAWFYTKSVALGGSTTLLVTPTDFKEALAIVAPTAYGGMIRDLTHRENKFIQQNARLAGTAGSPTFTRNFNVGSGKTELTITPATDGVLWYLWRFSEVAATNTTFEVTEYGGANPPIIPFPMEELIILQATLFSNQRHALSPDINPDALKQQMDSVKDEYDSLLEKMQASVQATQEVQAV